MSRCTAPVRGHKSAAAACPACRNRGGYRPSYNYDTYSPYSSSGNYGGSTRGTSSSSRPS